MLAGTDFGEDGNTVRRSDWETHRLQHLTGFDHGGERPQIEIACRHLASALNAIDGEFCIEGHGYRRQLGKRVGVGEATATGATIARSEERRVGKECVRTGRYR